MGAKVNITDMSSLNNYHVSLQVSNCKLFAYVDCGADVSCINLEMLQKYSANQGCTIGSPVHGLGLKKGCLFAKKYPIK